MFAPGTIIHERYEIIRLLGQGGMGAVYEVLDRRLQRHAALKQMLAPGDPLARQFLREARILARLRHSALPLVSDFFVTAGVQFLVMDYIEGQTLAQLLAQRLTPCSADEVLRWADVLLDVLGYLHQQTPPIIHRDIKPHNITITPTGQLVLLDFGLAKGMLLSDGAASKTQSVFGYTIHYAPIEQIQGHRTDQRSDLYALGATLYHLLSGQPPIAAPHRIAAILGHEPDPLVGLDQLNPSVPAALVSVIHHLLALDPPDRPADSRVVRTHIRTIPIDEQARPPLRRLSIQAPLAAVQATAAAVTPVAIPPLPTAAPPAQPAQPAALPRNPAVALPAIQRSSRWWWRGEWLIWCLVSGFLSYTMAEMVGLIIGGLICLLALVVGEISATG